MKKDISDHLKHDANSLVFIFLEGTSSHSDLSEFFHKTIVRAPPVKIEYADVSTVDQNPATKLIDGDERPSAIAGTLGVNRLTLYRSLK